MRLLRHAVGGLVIFAMLIGLVFSFYSDLKVGYDIPNEQKYINGGYTNVTIAESLNNLHVIEGFDMFTSIFDPDKQGSATDILGAIALSGLGALLLIIGVFSFPFQIADILNDYYNLPPMFIKGLLILMCTYIVFIYLSAKTRGDL